MPTYTPESWEGREVETKSGVKYFMRMEGFREKWAQDGNQTTILAVVDYAQSDRFLNDMLGYSTVVGGKLSRVLPEYNPFARHQWCTACDLIETHGEAINNVLYDNWISFDDYVYQCTFTSPLWEYLEDDDVGKETVDGVEYRKEWLRSTVVRPKLSGKNQIVPGNSFVTNETRPQPLQQTTTILVTETRYEVQWMEVPINEALENNIRNGLGKINKTPITIKTGASPWVAQTVLFEDVEITPRRSSRGDLTADIKYVFRRKGKGKNGSGSEIDVTWNMLPRANRSFIGVHVKGEPSEKPYTDYEFRKLFSFS